MFRSIAVLASVLLLTGCSDWNYQRTDTGKLKGTIIVKWLSQDRFVFLPDAQDPLTFTRKDNQVIQPGEMYTDGGTIPPTLRAIKAYSPWGYAPAFIVHDWLFVMQACKLPGHDNYDVEKAATVMAEIIKTMMEDPKYGGPNKLVLYSLYEGVRSKQARDYWDNGVCDTPTGKRSAVPGEPAPSFRELRADTSLPTFVIKFP